MDIKELKFLDIQKTVNKPGSGQGAATEPSFTTSGGRGQSNRVPQPHATSSTAPITILRRGTSELRFNHRHSLFSLIETKVNKLQTLEFHNA